MSEVTLISLEAAATLLCLLLAGAIPKWGAVERVEERFRAVAGRKRLAICIAGLAPVLVRVALLPVMPPPNPVFIEEFSNLLLADTFASGRLANPAHPLAEHLETYQELMHPTYSSFRPPGQGLFMAAGQVIFGHPWAGVVLSVAAFAAALCWMMQAWTSPGWALLGALLAGFWYGVFGFWMNSYWGGSVAALGGCLVVGAVPRIQNCQSRLAALWLCAGIALLFMTRAYEGMFVLIPAAGYLTVWLLRPIVPWRRKLTHVVVPILCGLLIITGCSLYYNWKTVGDPFVTPYQAGRSLYNMAPPFLFQKPNLNLRYTSDVYRHFYVDWELQTYQQARTLSGYVSSIGYRLRQFWRMYIRPELLLPLLLIPVIITGRRLRLPAIMAAFTVTGLSIETWSPPYYYAPVTGVLILLLMAALQQTERWTDRGRPLGPAITRAIVASCAITMVMATTLALKRIPVTGQQHYNWISLDRRHDRRAALEWQLECAPGKHLVIVRYQPDHNPHLEWVWNRADIDRSKVVWAHSITPEKDARLIGYFPDRQVWLLDPDSEPLRLEAVPEQPFLAHAAR